VPEVEENMTARMEIGTFDVAKIAARYEIPYSALRSAVISITPDEIRERLIAKITAFVVSNEIIEERTTETDYSTPVRTTLDRTVCHVPVTWWDHVKEALNIALLGVTKTPYFMVDYRDIHVVQNYRHETTIINNITKQIHNCPHLQISPEQQHVRFLKGD
jgi:hypothetical protein